MQRPVIALLASIAAAGVSAPASSAPLSDLIAGGSLTQGDVTFSNFLFSDFGIPGVDPGTIEVTTSAAYPTVSLAFAFNPVAEAFFSDFVEFFLDFDATVDANSQRQFNGVTISLDSASAGGDGIVLFQGDTLVEPILLEAEISSLVNSPTDSASLTPVSALAALTTVQLEAFGDGDSASLSQMSVTFELTEAAVPLPAGLPLVLTGVGALLLAARRRSGSARPTDAV